MQSANEIEVTDGLICAQSNSATLTFLADILRNPTRAQIFQRMDGNHHLAEIARQLSISDQDMGFHMRFIRKLPPSLLERVKTDGRRVYWKAKIDITRVFFNTR